MLFQVFPITYVYIWFKKMLASNNNMINMLKK